MTQTIKELMRLTASVVLTYGLLLNAPAAITGQTNPTSPKEEVSKPQSEAAGQIAALKEAERLSDEADRLQGEGQYELARPLAERALAIKEKALGAEHPSVSLSLNNLAVLYRIKGDYARAEPLYQRALEINEMALGYDHPSVAMVLNNLALLYYERGDYARAEPLYQRALAIRERTLGSEHPDIAVPLNNLALLYYQKGDYARAEPLYRRALMIKEQALGSEHPSVALSFNNLALLYQDKGDYARAEPLYQRALAIRERTLGSEHPDVAISLNNLAELYRTKGDYARAEPLYQRALAINEKALGAEHTSVAMFLNNLAELYRTKGDNIRAEPLYQRALAIKEKALGAEHPSVALSLNNFASLYYQKGDNIRAEPLYQRALEINEKALGSEHPNVALSLSNLAVLYSQKGDYARAVQMGTRSNDIRENNLSLILATGSERQKLVYIATLSAGTDGTISLHTRSAPSDPQAMRLALITLLRRKGRTLDAMSDQIGTLRRRLNPQDRALLDQLSQAQARLATLVFRGSGKTPPAEYRAAVARLDAEVEQRQAAISNRSAEFRAQAKPVTVEQVQKAIPVGAALVEIVSYQPFNPKAKTSSNRYEEARYAAYVLSPEGKLQWTDLGAAKDIERDVQAFRQALADRSAASRGEVAVVREAARALDKQVMQPVRKLTGGAKHLLVSPDGQLNLIPFGAFVTEQNRYLLEDYSITYLSSGRDLLRLQAKNSSDAPPLIIANPQFDEAPVSSAADKSRKERSADFSLTNFEELTGTADEAEALSKILPDAKLLTGAKAAELALKQTSRPSILHVATHGFFLPNQSRETVKPTADIFKKVGDESLFQAETAPGENPLLRSGLALAGANKLNGGDGEDGILTALEAAGLDLWGTRLVVLSACRTGEGDVKNGDGVYGLRRALVLAGAESQVMSLWRVNDVATSDLMVKYYKHLKAGEGRTEALRRVQLGMLAGGKWRHPYFWAAFIQSGEWKSL